MLIKPYITPRRAASDKSNNPGERTAELGAGGQSLILSVGHHSDRGQDGARIDLSWPEKDQPLLLAVPIDKVVVTTYHFNHRVSAHRTHLFASECVDALARIHQLMDGKEVGGQTLSDIGDILTYLGLLIADPNNIGSLTCPSND